MPTDLTALSADPAAGSAAERRWQLGRQALEEGRHAEARQHLLAALEFHAASPALLFDLVRASGDDVDLQALWAERFVRAAADAEGRLRIDPAQRKQLAKQAGAEGWLTEAQKLAKLRAAAVQEVVRFVDKHKPAPKPKANSERAVLVRWAAELLLEATAGAPNLLAQAAPPLHKATPGFLPDHDAVLQGLLRLVRQAAAAGPGEVAPQLRDRAIRAARIVLGLQRQAGFRDLQGPPPPNLGEAAAEARQALDSLPPPAVADARVWTIAELEALSPADAERFTAEHRTWRRPGLATSPAGRYRVETVCGHETLLAVARTVELHHARLVGHYGKDPFVERQGTVRIVPEHSDLETEGVPFWWAGGFQAGDRTTVRFAWDSVPALGRTLTHELTHRFDGVLRPFLGSWYGEGHAQWTGGHYARMTDTGFVDDHLDLGAVARTNAKGYGDRGNFEKLLRGEVADYRDNYFAGYSLYAFLRSFPPQEPPRYREALDRFERSARAGQKDPVAWFTTAVCDGQQGRPSSFDGFVAEWQRFLRGCSEWLDDRKEGNEWVGRYGGLGRSESAPLVHDEPTWSWARVRAEPWFGQDHAAAATLLLHEAGDRDATIAAGLWSTTVDGWRPDTAAAVLAALRGGHAAEPAAAFAALVRTRYSSDDGGAASPLLPAMKACRTLLEALAARSQALAAAGAAVAAAATDADHAALGRMFGLPARVASGAMAPPSVPTHLGGHGFAESSLTGFDDRRTAGLWYAAEGDLHVGRERPRDGTGSVDRVSHQRDAFVHTVAWQEPGAYVLRGRVHFTTSFVAGAIVFGHQRRDRGLRLHFRAGDFRYAVGKRERQERRGRIDLELQGLWERDHHLPDATPAWQVEIPPEQGWFDYALHVRGPRVLVEVNGEALLRYAVHDGSPIEGQVGFAMSMGAVRVQQPTVQRLDSSLAADHAGLDLARQPLVPLDDLLLAPTRGVPRAPSGTLLLWLPKVADGSPADGLPRALPELGKLLKEIHAHPQAFCLAVPRTLPAAERVAIQQLLAEYREQAMPVLEHDVGEPFGGSYPWVLFVDGLGVLRAAAEVGDPKLHTKVQKWARLFRSR